MPPQPLTGLHKFWEIARTGVTAILLHPLRSVVTIVSLVAILAPYTAGLGISQGLQQQAEDSIRFGANLYVTGSQFGRNVPVSLATIPEIEKLDGVTAVIPRIVGGTTLGINREPVVVVGLPVQGLPPSTTCVEGRLYGLASRNEFVIGTELAQRLNLKVGSLIPPFYRNERGEQVSKVVGVFAADGPLWQSRLIFTSLESAAEVFDQRGLATDLLVDCRDGLEAAVRRKILQMSPVNSNGTDATRLQVTSRSELRSLLPSGLLHREGVFNLHFLLAFVVGILVILVTSGLGLSERRREIGVLKATGWQTDEILLRGLAESLFLSFTGAAVALLMAFVWLNSLNGYWIAGVFLSGVDAAPTFRVPCRLTPIPTLLCFLMSAVLVLSGTLSSSWRAAIVSPAEAMR
jgi:ABC-type lipoprotein release transport system permease subunit